MPPIPDEYYRRKIRREMETAGAPWQSRRSCTRKVRHPDEAAATAEAVRLLRTRRLLVTPYRCWKCGEWHTGRLPPEDKRK